MGALRWAHRYITRKGVTTEEYHPFADIAQWSVLDEGDAFAYWASEEDLVVLQSDEVRVWGCPCASTMAPSLAARRRPGATHGRARARVRQR